MIQRVLLNHQHPGLTSLGLLIFMAVFVGALAWVRRKGSARVYADLDGFLWRKFEMSDQEEGKKIKGHNYDGIEELDNSLPRWWINLFYLTIVFAAGYFGYYSLGNGPGVDREYRRDKEEYDFAQGSAAQARKIPSEKELLELVRDPARVAAGKAVFRDRCVSCHGEHAQGGIGPNLTDEYWLHGGTMTAVLITISQGVLDKGMPPWGSVLKPDELVAAVAYVKSVSGTHPAGAKPPQGDRIQK